MQIRTLAPGALILMMGSISFADTLVDYKPIPVSPTLPEFVFNGPANGKAFQTGPGAIGNGDGALPTNLQTAGGLNASTPFIIPGVPGSLVNGIAGSTDFYDTSLLLTGLPGVGAAIVAGPNFIQTLGGGGFALFDTSNTVLLLSGNITTASFIVGSADSGATFNALGVNYTGGKIFTAMVAAGISPNGNSMSISMTDVAPPFGIDGADGMLANFTANGTGLFNDHVPEPASLGLLGAGLLMAGMRRSRR